MSTPSPRTLPTSVSPPPRVPRPLEDLRKRLGEVTERVEQRLPPAQRRRHVLAARIAVGCNIGPQWMAAASPGIGIREISQIADWYFTEDTLQAARVDRVNDAARLPISRRWGAGETCSADGKRFYVPVHILAADYSSVLGARGVPLLAHTADNYLRLHHKPVPCRLRESTFCLDGLLERETELDPRVCYTDTGRE